VGRIGVAEIALHIVGVALDHPAPFLHLSPCLVQQVVEGGRSKQPVVERRPGQQRTGCRPAHCGRFEIIDIQLKQHEVRRHLQYLAECLDVLGQVVARNPEVQYFVLRPERRSEQVGKSLAVLDPLPPGEGIANDRDSITVGVLCTNFPIAKPQTVDDDARPVTACEERAAVGARMHVTKDVPHPELGDHERDGSRKGSHRNANGDSSYSRSAPPLDTPTRRDSREPGNERHVQQTVIPTQPADLKLATDREQAPGDDGHCDARSGESLQCGCSRRLRDVRLQRNTCHARFYLRLRSTKNGIDRVGLAVGGSSRFFWMTAKKVSAIFW